MIQLLYNLPSQVSVLIRQPWAAAGTMRRNTGGAGGPPAVLHYPRTVRAGTSPGLLPCQREVFQYVHQQVRGLAEARRATANIRVTARERENAAERKSADPGLRWPEHTQKSTFSSKYDQKVILRSCHFHITIYPLGFSGC